MAKEFGGLPAEDRMKYYLKAIELRKSLNWGSYRIANFLGISKGTVDCWLYYGAKPKYSRRKLSLSKGKEFAYCIGVILGDASVWKDKRGNGWIELKAKDEEFVKRFAFCLQKILNKKDPYPIQKSGKYFRVIGGSIELYNFIKSKTLPELVGGCGPNFKCFLQGIFDSEGNPHIEAKNKFDVRIGLSNTSLELLNFVQKILAEKFGIKSYILLCNKMQTEALIKNRKIRRNKNVYRLVISSWEDVKRFATSIKFTPKRKQRKLENAILLKEFFPHKKSIRIWKKLYRKIGREWENKKN
jgi:intein-encoded DNA endonuclease-like protein